MGYNVYSFLLRRMSRIVLAGMLALVSAPLLRAGEDDGPREKKGSFVVYTNALYLAGLTPNVGTLVHLGSGWALDVRGGGAWWSVPSKDFYWRIYGAETALRKYFRRPVDPGSFVSLTGPHIGLYGQFFTYDFELGKDGVMGGEPGLNIFRGPQYGAGIELGWTIPAGRRLNVDLSVGLGYHGGRYHVYEPFRGEYVWRSTYQRNWFGPTRADVTLQWLIGRASNRSGKEGRR